MGNLVIGNILRQYKIPVHSNRHDLLSYTHTFKYTQMYNKIYDVNCLGRLPFIAKFKYGANYTYINNDVFGKFCESR